MVLPVSKEKRLFSRRKLTGLMPGKLTVASDQRCITARPTDVSQTGLGVLSTDLLAESAELELTIGKTKIVLVVLWKKDDFGKSSLYRYGLSAKDPAQNLETIFIETGCLK